METGYKIVCINCNSSRISHHIDENGRYVFICRDCGTIMDLEHILEEILFSF